MGTGKCKVQRPGLFQASPVAVAEQRAWGEWEELRARRRWARLGCRPL